MKKILIIIPVIIIVLIAVLYFSLNAIIKHGVETVGSQASGADIILESVNMSPVSGKGQIKGLFVGNPAGFQSESAFKMNEIRLALDVRSLFSDKIIIDEIYIDAPDITYETKGKTDNVKTILNNVKSFAGVSGGTTQDKTQKKSADKTGKKEKKVEISSVIMKNGKVHMSVTALKGEQLTLDLPDIHLKDIGKKGKGATMSEAMEQILAALNKNVGISVEDSVKAIREKAEKKLKDSVEKAVGGDVEGTVDKLKGMFGK
jgi:uncharacterized protein involved in outer membrane biogenesis